MTIANATSAMCPNESDSYVISSPESGRPIEAAFFDGDVGDFLFASGAFEFGVLGVDCCLLASIVIVGEPEKDQPKYGDGIFAGLQVGIGTQFVGGVPQVGSNFLS